MYARVARWEGGSADSMRATVAEIQANVGSGPPDGVPAKGITFLIDPAGGRGIAITLFATEEDLHIGDATLNGMSPPGDGMGNRVAVELYEVGIDVRL
jgi:hypothetical protein